MWPGRRPRFSLRLPPAALCLLLLAGCRGPDLLPDLRLRESHFRALRDDLWQNDFGQLTSNRQGDRRGDANAAAPAQAAPSPSLRHLSLASTTGGYDADGQDGDESLRVVLEPRDENERPLQVPGTLRVAVFQAGPAGEKVPLGDWEVSAEQLAQAWQTSWTGAGYKLILPWKTAPTAEEVQVVARLTLADGIRHEAARDVRVRPMPVARNSVAPAAWEPARGERTARSSPQDGTDTGVRQTAVRWEPASLEGAVRLRRPEPLLVRE